MDSKSAIKDDWPYEKRLFEFSMRSRARESHFLIFRGLQRLNILRLQNELAKRKRQVWSDEALLDNDPNELTQILHNYTNAIRDYEYLTSLAEITGSQARDERLDLEQAFFKETGEVTDEPGGHRYLRPDNILPSDPLRNFLKRILPRSWTYTKHEMVRRTDEYLDREHPEEVAPLVDRIARFLVALIGGFSVVAPMLVMRLPVMTLTKSLITTSVSVILFAAAFVSDV